MSFFYSSQNQSKETELGLIPDLSYNEIVDYPTGLNDSHIKEISYEEHLENLKKMSETDKSFMEAIKQFCKESVDGSSMVEPLSNTESSC
jgi:hypothetical protein